MSGRRIGSIRIWQTGLFVVVIVVAMLILSGSLSAGLQGILTRMAETNELRNASALAQRLSPEFPIEQTGLAEVREVIADYRSIYGGGIWVYDAHGELIESEYEVAPIPAALEAAQLGALRGGLSYSSSELKPNGYVIAAKALAGRSGEAEGVVVTASIPDQQVAILHAVRDRLWTTFWVSLAIAGLIGFGFAEIVGRRIRSMSAAAKLMEAGDFELQLPTGMVPDEIQELAESYDRMATRLGETFDSQRRFVADASHEMRTPIAAIKGMLELLADGAKEVPEVRDDFINTMQFEADRLGRLVADLLTLAQLEAGSLRINALPVDPSDLLGNVSNVMQTLAEQASVTLSVELPDTPVRAMADRDKITQVLLSFTDNALKHAPGSSTVHLRAIPDDGTVRFEVTDEGPGISAEEVNRVFERFYRADSARVGTGTGLGLAIAKEIVEAHGSEIEVTTSDKGTSFAFTLPAA